MNYVAVTLLEDYSLPNTSGAVPCLTVPERDNEKKKKEEKCYFLFKKNPKHQKGIHFSDLIDTCRKRNNFNEKIHSQNVVVCIVYKGFGSNGVFSPHSFSNEI